MKKVSRREAQRVRATPLHQDRGRPGAINAPNPATPPREKPDQPAIETQRSWFGQWRDRCRQWLTQRSEPRIEVIRDAAGQTWWRAYNPRTQSLTWLTSDTEVRLWLSSQSWP
jgi:hypothetical protein